MLTTILATIVVLGVLIFVHELGHFLTAKWFGIGVPRFSIGFGPKVIGFRRGETEYVISALPLGGYVKMAGMEEMERVEGGPAGAGDTPGRGVPEPDSRDFESKPLPVRALVISAGVIMNLAFAVVAFAIVAGVWGVAVEQGTRVAGVMAETLPEGAAHLAADVRPGATIARVNNQPVESWREFTLALTRARAGETRIDFADAPPVTFPLPADDEERFRVIGSFEPLVEPVLGDVIHNGPAARAGLQAGDRILEAGGQPVLTWRQFVAIVERSPRQPLPLVVDRNGQRVSLTVTPAERTLADGTTGGRIDVAMLPQREPVGPIHAAAFGVTRTWETCVLIVDFLIGMITGRHSARNIGGPIMIGEMSGRFARAGIDAFLTFMAILSINLAILNLLPIPVLDGGHLVFLGIEAVRGRALSLEQRMRLTQVGFVFIIMLMAWAIGNDLLRVIGI
jgi:regulator of sigma E protease